MKSISLVAAAVSAALFAGLASAAAPTITDANAQVKLVISGSSAFQSAFESELSSASSSVCASGSYIKYTATVTSGTAPGLFAYTCTSQNNYFGASTGQKTVVITYRTEGGSIYGLTPVVRAPNNKVLRLVVDSTCSYTGTAGTCAVGTSYNTVTDVVTGATAAVVDANSDLGLSDLEASQFQGSNYPDSTIAAKLQPALSKAERTSLNATASPLVLQSFAFYVRNTASATGAAAELNALTTLSRESIAAIYAGAWTDWNQVPKNDGSNTTVTSSSLPIVACRREAGSGTQVSASIFLHGTNCGGADLFVTTSNPGALGSVITNTSTGNMRTCITGQAGAIGFISAEAGRTGLQMIRIDGKGVTGQTTALDAAALAPLGVATASGDYGFAYEVVAVKKSGLSGDALKLATSLITTAQDQTKGPTTPNVTYLPTGVNAGNALFPLATPTGKQPVSCFTRSGNSCSPLSDAC